jgi:hypothetical protein
MPGGAGGLGAADAFLQGYGADGNLLFTHQYGTAEADSASALTVEGSAVVVAGVENGRAVLRRFDLAAPDARGAPTQAAVRDLGDLSGGAVIGVALSGGRVTVVGSTSNGALSAGAVNRAHGGGRDAFVASLNAGLNPDATDRLTYWGGAGEDAVSAAAIRGGEVWITGASTGDIDGAPRAGLNAGDRDGFVARLDAATGAVGWVRRWTAKDGEAAPSTIAVAKGGASVLDRLGLPSGSMDFTGAQEIAASTSARAGDRFYVRVNGGRQVAVTLEAKDTLKTLTERINRALGFNGRAEVVRSGAMTGSDGAPLPGAWDRIEIKARNMRSTLELIPGEAGRDLLGVLGLMEGTVLRTTRDSKGKEITPEGGKTYGLKLARDLKLDSKEAIKRTLAELDTGKTTIRTAYRALADALKPPAGPAISGRAPAWMQEQTANYQAALSRLGG